MGVLRSVVSVRFVGVALVSLALAGCSVGLKPYARVPSTALETPGDTALGKAAADAAAAQPGKSGFRLLSSGSAAFGARLALIDAAERTLDLEDRGAPIDDVGSLFCERLLRAADRGVRVRLLLDDLPVGPRGESLASLATHANIQIRLFNPIPRRTNALSRFWNNIPDDPRSNRRLHGRAVVADNAAATVGGRFGSWQRPDGDAGAAVEALELLAAGPVVQQLSAHFDEFWESDLSVPVGAVYDPPPSAGDLVDLRSWLRKRRIPLPWLDWLAGQGDLPRRLRDGSLGLTWASARLLADRPGFARQGDEKAYGIASLAPLLAEARSELLTVSPYFVPGRDGLDALFRLKARGVAVRVLTFSLSATDVPPVQSIYAGYRAPLLLKKVELHELRRPEKRPSAALAGNQPLPGLEALEPSLTSSHSRALVFDRNALFVGTIALDPRLAAYASELGVLVESPELAQQVAALVERALTLEQSFRVGLEKDPKDSKKDVLVWNGREGGKEYRYETEPDTNLLERVYDGLLPLFAPDGL